MSTPVMKKEMLVMDKDNDKIKKIEDEEEDDDCPLCMEKFDLDDKHFYPCTCQYQICRFCWHRILSEGSGQCPMCRSPYSDARVTFKPVSTSSTSATTNENDKSSKLRHNNKKNRQSSNNNNNINNVNRETLTDLRVVMQNLLFVHNLPRGTESSTIGGNKFFGRFGKIVKAVTTDRNSAYITYERWQDAIRALLAVNSNNDLFNCEGKPMKASLGTTKYCSHFIRGLNCSKPNCMYLHSVQPREASFTREEMQSGKHTEYEKLLVQQFRGRVSNGRSTATSVNGTTKHSPPTTSAPSTAIFKPNSALPVNPTTNNHSHLFLPNLDAESSTKESIADTTTEEVDNQLLPSTTQDSQEQDTSDHSEDKISELDEVKDEDAEEPYEDNDDLEFDPFAETQKAFQDLLYEHKSSKPSSFSAPSAKSRTVPLTPTVPDIDHDSDSMLRKMMGNLEVRAGDNVHGTVPLPKTAVQQTVVPNSSLPQLQRSYDQHPNAVNHLINSQQALLYTNRLNCDHQPLETWNNLDPAIIFSSKSSSFPRPLHLQPQPQPQPQQHILNMSPASHHHPHQHNQHQAAAAHLPPPPTYIQTHPIPHTNTTMTTQYHPQANIVDSLFGNNFMYFNQQLPPPPGFSRGNGSGIPSVAPTTTVSSPDAVVAAAAAAAATAKDKNSNGFNQFLI